MTVELNHTIVRVTDQERSARYYADLLGLEAPTRFGPFLVVQMSNGVSLDFADDHGSVSPQHYAFLVSEPEFDEIRARLEERDVTFYADPAHRTPGRWNTNDGGRGLYWSDPDGHNLEIITVPYGG